MSQSFRYRLPLAVICGCLALGAVASPVSTAAADDANSGVISRITDTGEIRDSVPDADRLPVESPSSAAPSAPAEPVPVSAETDSVISEEERQIQIAWAEIYLQIIRMIFTIFFPGQPMVFYL